jgi:hypothetical protein
MGLACTSTKCGSTARFASTRIYRVTPTGETLQGWDNAPHHPEVATFPHHLHLEHGIEASDVRTLTDVLELLRRSLS